MVRTSSIRFVFAFMTTFHFSPEEKLAHKVNNLNATKDREACEGSHLATNKTQQGFRGQLATTSFRRKLSICHLQILFHLVKG